MAYEVWAILESRYPKMSLNAKTDDYSEVTQSPMTFKLTDLTQVWHIPDDKRMIAVDNTQSCMDFIVGHGNYVRNYLVIRLWETADVAKIINSEATDDPFRATN